MIKDLIEKQVVCSQRNEKGKACHGGLKRYHPFADYYNETAPETLKLIEEEFGSKPNLVLLKCETCATVYRLPQVLGSRYPV